MNSAIPMHEHSRRLSLASSNDRPMPRRMPFWNRMLILFTYSLSACISWFCVWAVTYIVRSF